jgi:hypothetical protein
VDRVMKHKIYIVAPDDRDLKRRIRKAPGVPIMSVARGKYVIERLPGGLITGPLIHLTANLTVCADAPEKCTIRPIAKTSAKTESYPSRKGNFAA